jgi:putative transport protein
LGLAIFVGGVIGVLATFAIANLKISLGTNIGTLLVGLVVGLSAPTICYSGGFPTAPSLL